MKQVDLLQSAIALRKKGYSLQEVAEELNISKSTASLWLSSIPLSQAATARLKQKQLLGQKKAVLIHKQLREKQLLHINQLASTAMHSLHSSQFLMKVFCALMWWCEGNKKETFVRFTSSDETLVKNYLSTFRSGFQLDERKFRVLVHLHTYHNDQIQKEYWSSITKIPLTQFHKSFQKSNTGIRKHENYQGCIAITYYDAKIAKELEAIYNAFTVTFT